MDFSKYVWLAMHLEEYECPLSRLHFVDTTCEGSANRLVVIQGVQRSNFNCLKHSTRKILSIYLL
jgi:hypothetical protein